MRKDKPFPMEKNIMLNYIEKAWINGWFDEYSDEHFLIKVIEKRLNDFVGKRQLIENNLAQFCVVGENGNLDTASFCLNFCMNFSCKLQGLSRIFGEDKIKKFVIDQLSAGKKHYNEDTFFQALSEVSILSFYASRCGWSQAIYEPSVKAGVNEKNPEAKFVVEIPAEIGDTKRQMVIVNVEVKSPAFPHNEHINEKIAIPTILLTEKGRNDVKKYCEESGVLYLPPRIKKIVDFINSAASKFEIPGENELNLLYINWSYRDFPSNSFLEPASLLSNVHNGLLLYPEIAKQMNISEDAFDKISAIVVYTESLEGLMFSDFRHVWQERGAGPRFKIFVLDKNIKQNICNNNREFIFKITGMNPCLPITQLAMIDYKSKNEADRISAKQFAKFLEGILNENMLS